MNRNRVEYERRVNRVIDYIESNPTEELSLDRLAQIAAFSPHHFHRVFKSITNETLYEFSQRLRIEKGAHALLASTDRTVTQATAHCGFASAATFARAFKAHFGMSATEWRTGGYKHWRAKQKNSDPNSKDRKPSKADVSTSADTRARPKVQRKMQIKALPSYRIAYMRHRGPYGPSGIARLWDRLRKWMSAHDLDLTNDLCIGIAYDNPNIASAETCRYDACVVVPADFVADRQVNICDTASGRYAVCEFNGTGLQIVATWERTFGEWLPDSGFAPDDRPCIELYRGASAVDPTAGPFKCDLCLPIRRL